MMINPLTIQLNNFFNTPCTLKASTITNKQDNNMEIQDPITIDKQNTIKQINDYIYNSLTEIFSINMNKNIIVNLNKPLITIGDENLYNIMNKVINYVEMPSKLTNLPPYSFTVSKIILKNKQISVCSIMYNSSIISYSKNGLDANSINKIHTMIDLIYQQVNRNKNQMLENFFNSTQEDFEIINNISKKYKQKMIKNLITVIENSIEYAGICIDTHQDLENYTPIKSQQEEEKTQQ